MIWISSLEVDGLVVGSHGSLLHGLRKSRVGVASASNVLSGSTVLDTENALSNELTSVGTNHVDTEDAVSLGISEDLDDTLSIIDSASTRVGHEGELADLVLDALSLEVLLVLTDGGDLRVGVDDTGDGVVVDVAVLASHDLDSGNTFLLGLVGEHGTSDNITDGVDRGDVGAEVVVNLDHAAVKSDTELLETEAISVGTTTSGDEDDITLDNLGLTGSVVLGSDLDNITLADDALDMLAEHEVELLLLKGLLEGLGNLKINTRGDAVSVTDDSHLRAETLVDRTELETDDTSTDDNETLGNLSEGESTSGSDDALLIDSDTGENSGLRTSGDEDVVGLDDLRTTSVEGDSDLVLASDLTLTDDVVDLVLLEKTLNTLGKTSDSLLLGLHEATHVHGDVLTTHDTIVLEVVLGGSVVVSGVKKSLGRNATNVQASTTEGATHLNASDLHTHLAGLDGSNVTTGTTTNDDEVILFARSSGESTLSNLEHSVNLMITNGAIRYEV